MRSMMLAVVQFPKDEQMEEISDALDTEIENLFDYMDERIEDGASAYNLLMAMIMVVKMVSDSEDLTKPVH